MPPREKPSPAEANTLPQPSPRETPQATLPLSKSASSPSAISLQKRRPGRPPKPRSAPTVNEASLPGSIPTQSDGKGSITKKRKLVSKTSDQAKVTSEKITITKSSKTKESPPRVNQNQVSQSSGTRAVSPSNLVQGQRMTELACRALKTEISLKNSSGPQEGDNPLLLEAKIPASAKPVSRVPNELLESEIEKPVTISGQALQAKIFQQTDKVTPPSKLGFEEESVDIPPVDENIKKRPTRKKRVFVGEIQRFADEDIEVLKLGNSAPVIDSDNSRAGKNNATRKIAKPRGRRKKILPVIRQGSPSEENLKGRKPMETKSEVLSSQLQGFLEKQPRRRGRPKKIALIVSEAGDPGEVARDTRPSEGDLGAHRSQIRNPQESLSTESEQLPIHNIEGKVIEPILRGVPRSPRLDGSPCAQIVALHEHPPLETTEQPRKESPSLGELIHPSNRSSNAHLDESEIEMHPPRNPQSKAHGRLSKKSRRRGEANGPLGASHSSRLHGSEFDMQIVDPCEHLSLGTQGQSSTVSTIQGQTSYSPGSFYSALLGESKSNTKRVNPLKNPPSTIEEQAQRISPPQSITNMNKPARKRGLALLQRQNTNKFPQKKGDLDGIFAPALERTEKEAVSRRMEVDNDELGGQTLQIEDSSTNQPGSSEVHLEMQIQALTKGKPNDTEIQPRERGDPQTQVPGRKRGRRKKETIPSAGLPSQTAKTKERSKVESRFASSKPSSNPIPIRVYRLSCDRGENDTAPSDSLFYINDKFVATADVLAQICHEFAFESHAPANHLAQSHLRAPLTAELKRKLEINEDDRGTLDGSLFQLVCTFVMRGWMKYFEADHGVLTFRTFQTDRLHHHSKPTRSRTIVTLYHQN